MRKLPGQAGLGVSLSTGAEQGRNLQFYHRPDTDRRPPGHYAHLIVLWPQQWQWFIYQIQETLQN